MNPIQVDLTGFDQRRHFALIHSRQSNYPGYLVLNELVLIQPNVSPFS